MGASTQMIPRYQAPPELIFSPANILKELIGDAWSQASVKRAWSNLKLLLAVQDMLIHGGKIDDRTYLTERVIGIAASLPNNSYLRSVLNGQFIGLLWTNLQHPPLSFIGKAYQYRQPDGSNNNITYSKDSARLGVTGSNYAQTVPPQNPPCDLPDPAVIFDRLLAREDKIKTHPTSVSSSLFHFATIITHDIFNTNPDDSSKSDTSSYLDLSPLYGSNQEQQDGVRTKEGGKLKPDTIGDWRFLHQPQGVLALLIAFNRFHNHVAGELARINENGRFTPADDDPKPSETKDNALFQTARLVTCGLYVNIVMNDYLRTILNLNRNPVNSNWKLDPRVDFKGVFDREGTPRGIGNQVSVEFNVIYRWHSCISEADEVWSEQKFNQIVTKAGTSNWRKIFGMLKEEHPITTPETWKYDNLDRKPDGSVKEDARLVDILTDATDNIAGSFGARNVPKFLKQIEILGIERGRREWGLTSLNEFRSFFNLRPYKTFSEVNPKREIAQALKELYGHPDNIELYPGLIAEATKEAMVPGSGLCPGFTTSFAILSDAVALVRGDRFYAVDYNPQNLTRWGYDFVESDPNIAGGGVMHKLLQVAFKDWYTDDSVYAKYPFTTPAGSKENTDNDFDTSPPMFMGKKQTKPAKTSGKKK